MGLLNNWLNKKKKEQLKKTGDKPEVKAVVKKEKEAKGAKTEKETKPKKILPAGSKAYQVLIRPLVTEKSAIAESANKYSFEVSGWTNKIQIKQAIKEIYGIAPTDVNVINMEGRAVRFGRAQGRRSGFKKAIVTLPQGKVIDIHAGV
ncbi:MAG: 50S ribosomal protein L23 [Patescibacteria group bacterium]